jgi:odorant receptor
MDKNILSQTSFLLTFKIYRLLAWNPLDENKTKTQIVYFVIAVFYGFLCFVKEMIYFVLHLGEENNFLVLTNNLPCAGFVVLTMAKISPIYVHRKVLIEMLKDLQEMNKLFLKINFLELRFVKISKKMLTIFTVLFMILIWIFNLMPLIKMGHSAIVGNQVIRQLPYYMWYPFDVHQPIVFEICYVIVNWGAFTCALGILTSDLLLCSFITLICMQFHNLKSRINEIIDKKKSDDILKFWIDNHSKLLVMCAEIEKIFSFSVLVNYTGSSIIICLAGFQTQVVS